MRRHKHSLSHYVLSTFDMGDLVPVCNFEVLPGDSVRMATSALLRCSPLVTPVMHPVTVRLHHWFVPYRLLWPNPDGWEDFITGGPDGDFAGPIPNIGADGSAGSVQSYLGVPAGLVTGSTINPWGVMAYNFIYNEFYRDEDLCPVQSLTNNQILRCAWEKDQFTSARPWAQKGPAVTLPMGESAPVKGIGIRTGGAFTNTNQGVTESGGGSVTYADSQDTQDGSNIFEIEEDPAIPGAPHIWTDLENATGPDVIAFRRAMAIQRYQEARAQYGSRYSEYLRYLGVRSKDARLQRPEYLGGGKSTISFSEVLRTGNAFDSESTADFPPVGQMAGHGISAMRTRRFIRFFEEHGIVMTLASVRPRTMYVDGLKREFTRTTKEDFWQKELEQIGQQEVFLREVYAQDGGQFSDSFGYQDRYYEYRHHPSYVTGNFRDTLADWHLGRIFGSAPSLNSDFVNCAPSKRIFAEQSQDSLWCTFGHSIQARRLVGPRSMPRIF